MGRGVRAVRGAHPRRARPPRHRRRSTAFIGNPVGHSFTLGRYMRAVHRAVGHAAHLLVGHRRPVAQERLVRPHVREHVEDPGARHPAHRLPDRAWAATRRRRAARCSRAPTCSARSTASARAAARSSSSIRAAPAPPTTPTSGCRSCPAPTPRSCSRSCNVLFAEGLDRRSATLEEQGQGRRRRARACAPSSRPSRSRRSAACPPTTIRRLAREIAAAPTGRGVRPHRAVQPGVRHARVVAGRRGEHRHRQLRPARRADVRQADRVADGVAGVDREVTAAREFGRWTSRVSRRARGARAGAGRRAWPRRSRRPGDGQIKALFTVAGNPVISVPDSARLEAALPELECMISVDNYLNETTRLAHVILPGPSPLEHAALRRAALGLGGAQRRQLERPRSSRRRRPARRVGDPRPPRLAVHRRERTTTSTSRRSTTAGSPRSAASQGLDAGRHPRRSTTAAARSGCIDLQVRTGPWGDRYGEVPDGLTLEQIKAQPHGIDLGPMVPRVDEMVCTPSGKIDLAPEYIVGDLAAPAARASRRPTTTASCSSSRRHLRSKNSWMHNVKVLVKGKDRCTLLVHPEDADGRRRSSTAAAPRVTLGGRHASRCRSR